MLERLTDPVTPAPSAGPGGGHPLLLPQRGGECRGLLCCRGSSFVTGLWLRRAAWTGWRERGGAGVGETRASWFRSVFQEAELT